MTVHRRHTYDVSVSWTGNRGTGTSGYRAYDRDHDVSAEGLPAIAGSSDPAFRGDPGRWNPELELTAALSQCHMLWYLHLCAAAGVVVTSYTDNAHGIMTETVDGGGRFVEVVLRPRVTVAAAEMIETATNVHKDANAKCFIANSVNFPVRHEPVITADGDAAADHDHGSKGEEFTRYSGHRGCAAGPSRPDAAGR
jgi:organic hydroperoxide reductase OsmC/OhrA